MTRGPWRRTSAAKAASSPEARKRSSRWASDAAAVSPGAASLRTCRTTADIDVGSISSRSPKAASPEYSGRRGAAGSESLSGRGAAAPLPPLPTYDMRSECTATWNFGKYGEEGPQELRRIRAAVGQAPRSDRRALRQARGGPAVELEALHLRV